VPQGRDSDGNVQSASRELNFHLAGGHAHAVAAAEDGFEILEDLCRKELAEGSSDQNFRGAIVSPVGVEHST
jgi:hypothetical protein